jgi:ferredoxin-nitrite reductase
MVLIYLGWRKEWEVYLYSHPKLQDLSAKFSLGLDGGETLSIRSFYNDVLVSAIDPYTVEVCLLGKEAIVIPLEEVLSILLTLADIYLEYTIKAGKALRLQDVYSKTDLWQTINDRLKQNYKPYNLITRPEIKNNHLGILPQNHPNLVAIGVNIPLVVCPVRPFVVYNR